MSVPPLRYLASADVLAAMPPLQERLALAERTLTALVADAELPAKLGVHPRPPDSFAHAMPALLRGAREDGGEDLLGLKWVTGSPRNREHGLPAIHAVIVLSDATSGVPVAVLDGSAITAHRTAAVSGVALRRFMPATGGRPLRVALIGAGVQGHSHLPVIGHVAPGARLALFDRHPERAAALAEVAAATPGIGAARVAASAREAVDAADVVVTAASFGPVRQVMTTDWLEPGALVVAVDYATYCAADVARDAALFLVDERDQFLANREAGQFDGYPDPGATLGEAILAGTTAPGAGRVVVTHLGVGLADVVFADAVVREAARHGLGTILPR